MITHCTVRQFLERHGIGRTTFYKLVREGKLRVVRYGVKKTLVPSDSEAEWVRSLSVLPTDGPTDARRLVADDREQIRRGQEVL